MFAAYWRINITTIQDTAEYSGISKIQMRGTVGGTDLCVGGTASANSSYSGNPASNAFDASDTTYWASLQPFNVSGPHWIQYQFTSRVQIVEFTLRARSDLAGSTPTAFILSCSDNGTDWVDVYEDSGYTFTAGQTRTFSYIPTFSLVTWNPNFSGLTITYSNNYYTAQRNEQFTYQLSVIRY
jgi:hypothetical protein